MSLRRVGLVLGSMLVFALAASDASAQCATSNATVAPAITLETNPATREFYFRDGGTQSLLPGRNPTG